MGENRYRSAPVELRDGADGAPPVMSINFARFNEWTRISSYIEGNFMERMAPGAFSKTFGEQKPAVIFQHGRDPQVGDKPLGVPSDLREGKDGAYADVHLIDAQYVRDIAAGVKAGAYGASFAFQVVREDVNQDPGKSAHNPDGLPEHTVREVRLKEFGPVTYPAYEGTSVGIRSRSVTDDVLDARALSSAPLTAAQPTGAEDKTSDESETPVEEKSATSQQLLRFGDRYLLVGPSSRDAGADHLPSVTDQDNEGDADA